MCWADWSAGKSRKSVERGVSPEKRAWGKLMDANTQSNSGMDLDDAIRALRSSEEKLAIATEALRKSEERATAGRLALEVMHEINNPLEALGHLTYLASEESENPEKVQFYMKLAEEQMANLNRIARQTLAFAQHSQKPKKVDLVGVAEAAIRIHQRAIREKRIHLVKDLSEGIEAEVHTGELLQVVSNLIVNALDALPAEGVLHLRLRKRQNEVQFVIADNGHGIPPDQTSAVFQPFFTTKTERGTGLGLALSKRIIERHQGRIRLRSSMTPGKSGTVFKISLPIP
jgi:signal transduction histidine kinase